MTKDRTYVCPECAALLNAIEVVAHILKQHPSSPIASAIRAEVREWVASR